jgi:pyruvate-formate lyase-activating enzyme
VRPQGEIRQAMRAAFETNGPMTWSAAAELAQVGYDAAQQTVKNMVRSGELRSCGREKPAGAQVWAHLYELNAPQPEDGLPGANDLSLAELARITSNWAAVD